LTGGDAFERLRKALGVDRLGADAVGGPVVGAQRAIDDRRGIA
jgi:hypothetical protein